MWSSGMPTFLRPDVVGLVILPDKPRCTGGQRESRVPWSGTPRPGNDFLLEVILEAEVAQHLKKQPWRAVMPTRSISGVRMHFWQVVTRCRGGSSWPRNHFFMGAMPLLISSRLGSSFRNQREAAETQVALRLKIMQVLFAKLVQSGPLHRCCSPIHKIAMQGPPQKLQPRPNTRDEGCYASVVPPGLQRRKNIIQQHCRFVSALTPQVRSALRRKLRGWLCRASA